MSQKVAYIIIGILLGAGASYIVIYEFLQQPSTPNQPMINELRDRINRFLQQPSPQDQSMIDELRDRINTYEKRIQELNAKLSEINEYFLYYQTEYYSLKEKIDTSYEVHIGNSLTSYYDALRYELGTSGSTARWYNADEECFFAAQLALHDLHQLSWPTVDDVYESETGEVSYLQAWEILNEVYARCDITNFDSDTIKIKKILEFININVEYQPEMRDINRAPVETLSLKSGDCDDYSILAAALFKMADIDSAIAYFEKEGAHHAMVLVKLDELDNYRYYLYADLTYYNLDSGTWILIEPQKDISNQGDDTMANWSIYAAAQVEYSKVA